MLKEVQAQNEVIFPVEASLRFLGDMVEWCIAHMPRWYPISISGYHIAEAGATPVQQAAYTLTNGFAYAELLPRPRAGRGPLRPAALVLPRLRPGRRIPRPRPGLPAHLGDRHAGRVRRRARRPRRSSSTPRPAGAR